MTWLAYRSTPITNSYIAHPNFNGTRTGNNLANLNYLTSSSQSYNYQTVWHFEKESSIILRKAKQNYNKPHKINVVVKLPPLQGGKKSVATTNGEESDSYETASNKYSLI